MLLTMITRDAETSITEDGKARSFIDPVWVRRYAEYVEQKGCLYRHYRSNVYNKLVPKLFVLYVPNCTVSKLHFGEPIFPFKSFYFCSDGQPPEAF